MKCVRKYILFTQCCTQLYCSGQKGGGGAGGGVSRGCNIIFLNFHIQKRVQVIKGKKLNIRKMSICSVTMLKHIIITGRV